VYDVMNAAVHPSGPIPMLKDLQLTQLAPLQVRRKPKMWKPAKPLGVPNAPLVRLRLTIARWKLEKQRNDGQSGKKRSEPVKLVNNKPVKRKRRGALQKNKFAVQHAKNVAPKKNKLPARPKQQPELRPLNDASADVSVKKKWPPKPTAAGHAPSLLRKSIQTK
jgi:hypothetical protein